MKVVILAGGFGTRISEESHLKPKPMIEIGEKPILWHIMKMYSHYGFHEFVICCGYKQHVIKEWFADYYLHNSNITFDFTQENKMIVHNNVLEPWKVTLVDTGLNTMTGGRIKRVREYLDGDTFMLTYGDGVADIDLKELLDYHRSHGKMATITAAQPGGRFGILDICEEYDDTISLGDACRPGCLADATDVCQIEELVRLGELTKRAWAHNVQVMVEGPGHVPLDQVAANMKVQQSICMGAPFYTLGPLVTDIAPGYDHITAAIGGAVAAMNGAAFLCYVTPAEHLALPNVDDVKQGIIASKIAAHAADIAKGIPGARDIDDKMADARQKLDWEAQYACALDPDTARAIRDSRRPEDDHSDTCSMCGKFCAVRSMNKALAGEYIDIL